MGSPIGMLELTDTIVNGRAEATGTLLVWRRGLAYTSRDETSQARSPESRRRGTRAALEALPKPRQPLRAGADLLRRSGREHASRGARHSRAPGHAGVVGARAFGAALGRGPGGRFEPDGAPRPRHGQQGYLDHPGGSRSHRPQSRALLPRGWTARRVRAGRGPSERERSRARQAHRHSRGLSRPGAALAGLRRHPRARADGRAAGYLGVRASPRDLARAAHARRQGAAFLLPGRGAARGLLRDAVHRERDRRGDVSQRAALLQHLQHQLTAAARRADDRRHHRFRGQRAADDRHALYARRRDGADHHLGGADALARRGALRHHPLADRAAGRPGDVRQLHLECRYEVGSAGFRHARVRQGGLRRRPAGPLHRRTLALLECDGLQRPGCPGGIRVPDEPVGGAARGLPLHAARRRLARRRADGVAREIHPRRRNAADVRGALPAGARFCRGDRRRGGRGSGARRAFLCRRTHHAALP